MKCKVLDTRYKPKKTEPIINEWLATNSHLNIKFIQESILGNILRVAIYYED